jgi:S-adenosylmethionine:diacylglycerol 3-amino-3-carboxypropyl transferase
VKRPVHAGVSDDLDLLVNALEPGPGRRYLSVSAHGAGEAALTMIGAGAAEVAAFDLQDPAMLARLIELKCAAARLLGREDYLVVLGLRRASDLRRSALARQLIKSLLPEQAAYWEPRRRWLEEGLFQADQISRFFAAFLWSAKLLAPQPALRAMFHSGDRAARREAFDRYLARPWLVRGLSELGRFNLFFPEDEWRASQYPRQISRQPLAYLGALVEHGLADNPLFAHLVREGPIPEPLLPPHSRPGVFDTLRAGGDRVRVIAPPPGGSRLAFSVAGGSFDGAYLSNVVDYLSPDERELLFREVRRALKLGAPILAYSSEADRKIPLEVGLEVDEEGAARLAAADRARVYRRVELVRVVDPSRSQRRLRVVSG